MSHLPRAVGILRGQVDVLRELVHQELGITEVRIQEGIGRLQIHICMAFIPCKHEGLGANGFVVIRLDQLSRFGLQSEVGVEAVNVRRSGSRDSRGAICSQHAKVIVETPVLLKHDDDVLNGMGRDWRLRHTHYNLLCQLRAALSRRGRCVRGGCSGRQLERSIGQQRTHVADALVDGK